MLKKQIKNIKKNIFNNLIPIYFCLRINPTSKNTFKFFKNTFCYLAILKTYIEILNSFLLTGIFFSILSQFLKTVQIHLKRNKKKSINEKIKNCLQHVPPKVLSQPNAVQNVNINKAGKEMGESSYHNR